MAIQILDRLFLGCLKDVKKKADELKSRGITHVLTVDDRPLSKELQELFTCQWVYACDTEDDDLLSHFESCMSFLDSALDSGQVLVHCRHGISRSAAVVVAYVMYKSKMTLTDALSHVEQMKPDICPNDGFMNQLKIFESMECTIQPTSQAYKRFKLNILASQMQTAKMMCEIPDDLLSADPSDCTQSTPDTTYKCRKCRRTLFRAGLIMAHTTGAGEAAFDWRLSMLKHDGKVDGTAACVKSLFVEPLKWMKRQITDIEGKLSCPKCDAKLGSFNWVGERCPCGQWITPAFHIQKTKVDEKKVLPGIQHARLAAAAT